MVFSTNFTTKAVSLKFFRKNFKLNFFFLKFKFAQRTYSLVYTP